MTSQRRTLTLVVMCVGMFLVLLDVTIVNVALPRLRDDLGASVGSLQWIVDGYAVALASLMLPCGDLGDRHGHKRVVLAGLAAFGAGSLAAGLAPGPALLIAGRVVQGAGAALLLPGTLAVVSRAYPDAAERARAIGIWPPSRRSRCRPGSSPAAPWSTARVGAGPSSSTFRSSQSRCRLRRASCASRASRAPARQTSRVPRSRWRCWRL